MALAVGEPLPNLMYRPEKNVFFIGFCYRCQQRIAFECRKHKFKHVFNRKVPRSPADKLFCRATETLPDFLFLKLSVIPGAGLGVFTWRFIKRNTIFGPYEGEEFTSAEWEDGRDPKYTWAIGLENGKGEKHVDGKNLAAANWMRYVNCARNDPEHNLTSVEYKENIFYVTIKDISPGTELLTDYGIDYERGLGCNLVEDVKECTFKHEMFPKEEKTAKCRDRKKKMKSKSRCTIQ